MKSRILDAVMFLLGIILSGTFIYAGGTKILDPMAFRRAVEGFELLPEAFITPFSWWIPWVEVFLGVSYWVIRYRLASLYGSMLLLGIFCFALLQANVRGVEVDCGCFGASASITSLKYNIVRNVFLITAGFLLVSRQYKMSAAGSEITIN